MFKRISCILTLLALALCLSSGSLAGITVVADEETYLTISSKGGTLSSGTYQLTDDLTISSLISITSDVTIDLNGHSIIFSGTSVITVSGGTLNLIDSSVNGGGSIINKSTSATSYGIRVSNGGILNIHGVTISGSYGIYSNSNTGCIVNITAGTVEAIERVAIYNQYGTTNISGTDTVIIASTFDVTNNYGLYNSSGTVLISNPNTYVSAVGTSDAVKASTSKSEITAGYYTSDVSKYVPDGYSCVASGNADYPYVVKSDTPEVDDGDEGDDDSGDGEEEEDSWLYGFSLRLDGAVGVNFYFDTAKMGALEEYYLVAKIGEDGEEEEIREYSTCTLYVEDDTENTTEINCICYTVYVKPNQFSELIYAYLTDGTSATDTYDYSVATYCFKAINENFEESDLCKALLNYGYYASVFEAGSGDNILDDIDGWVDPVTEEWTVDLSSYSGTTTDGVAKTLILGSSVVIRLYLTADVADEDDVFTFEGNTLEKYTIDDEYYSYYVEFKVPARKMSEMLTVSKNGEEFTKYSVLSYVNNVINSDEYDDALKNLCKAIYYYSVAADNYSGWI